MAAAVTPTQRAVLRNRDASTAKLSATAAESIDAKDSAQPPPSSTPSSRAPEKKRRTRASTSSAASLPVAAEDEAHKSLADMNQTLQSEEKHSQPEADEASNLQHNESRDQDEESTPIAKQEAPRRRESTRARKPSSRLLPSPSPPPPRSTSYYNFLKNNGQPAPTGSPVSPSPPASAPAGLKKGGQGSSAVQRASPALSNTAGDVSAPSDAATGPGKRKRRPSTMTKPPATITEALGTAMTTSSAAVPVQPFKANKGRSSSTKSATPEARDDRGTSVPPATKAARKLKITANGKPAQQPLAGNAATDKSGYDSDGNTEGALIMVMADDGDDSDSGMAENGKESFRKASTSRMMKQSTSVARSASGNTITVSSMRAAALAAASSSPALEPPPLISRRGGLKGSMAVHRQPATKGTSSHLKPVTPPSSDRWSWHRSTVSVPLLRFKLDNLTSRGDDEESSAAEDDDDDFHVAMLDGANFDGTSDLEDDVPGAVSSAKSSPRASKSYDGSDVEDTPATTPQSPQSTCDIPERRASDAEEETQAQPEAPQQAEAQEQSNVTGGKHVVRDTVFAHALEPSSTRPHTHAGALTLSLPFNEMPQPSDEDPSTSMRPGMEASLQIIQATSAASPNTVVKQEQLVHDAPSVTGDVDDKDEAAMEAELLGPATVASTMESAARQATAMILSSPNPGSAFASPILTTQVLVGGGKAEPMPLALPPAVSNRNEAGKAHTKLKNATRFDSAHSSDEDEHDESEEDEEHAFSQATLAMGPPESLCLSELERAWEQSEYLYQARKLATSTLAGNIAVSPRSEGNSEEDVEQLPLLEVDNTQHARGSTDKAQPTRKRQADGASAKEAGPAASRPMKKTRTPPSATKVTRSTLQQQQQQASPSARKARGSRTTGTAKRT